MLARVFRAVAAENKGSWSAIAWVIAGVVVGVAVAVWYVLSEIAPVVVYDRSKP